MFSESDDNVTKTADDILLEESKENKDCQNEIIEDSDSFKNTSEDKLISSPGMILYHCVCVYVFMKRKE